MLRFLAHSPLRMAVRTTSIPSASSVSRKTDPSEDAPRLRADTVHLGPFMVLPPRSWKVNDHQIKLSLKRNGSRFYSLTATTVRTRAGLFPRSFLQSYEQNGGEINKDLPNHDDVIKHSGDEESNRVGTLIANRSASVCSVFLACTSPSIARNARIVAATKIRKKGRSAPQVSTVAWPPLQAIHTTESDVDGSIVGRVRVGAPEKKRELEKGRGQQKKRGRERRQRERGECDRKQDARRQNEGNTDIHTHPQIEV